MTGVLTVVSAKITPERAHELTARFGEAVRAGMPERRQTTLLRGEGDLWQIMTVWHSRHDLDAYLASVEEPFALRLMRLAGGVPEVEVFEVVLDSSTLWWS